MQAGGVVPSALCNNPGCVKQANFNYRDHHRAIKCAYHKEIGMVQIGVRMILPPNTCEVVGCAKRPCFNYPGTERGCTCGSHKENGMVCVEPAGLCEHDPLMCKNLRPMGHCTHTNVVPNVPQNVIAAASATAREYVASASFCAAWGLVVNPYVQNVPATPTDAPPELRYMNRLTKQGHVWPRRADGRLLDCSDVEAILMLNCVHIAYAKWMGWVCIRRLSQTLQRSPPIPLRLPRVLHAAPSPVDAAPACVHVTAATRVRVSCAIYALLAVKLVTNRYSHQTAKVRIQWSESVSTRVFSGHCEAVQVAPCAVLLMLQQMMPRCRHRQ